MLTEPKHKSGRQIQQNQRWKYSKLSAHIRKHKHPTTENEKQARQSCRWWQKAVLQLQIHCPRRTGFTLQCKHTIHNFTACSLKILDTSSSATLNKWMDLCKNSVTTHLYSSSRNLHLKIRRRQNMDLITWIQSRWHEPQLRGRIVLHLLHFLATATVNGAEAQWHTATVETRSALRCWASN